MVIHKLSLIPNCFSFIVHLSSPLNPSYSRQYVRDCRQDIFYKHRVLTLWLNPPLFRLRTGNNVWWGLSPPIICPGEVKAVDKVLRQILWNTMYGKGISCHLISVLKEFYYKTNLHFCKWKIKDHKCGSQAKLQCISNFF